LPESRPTRRHAMSAQNTPAALADPVWNPIEVTNLRRWTIVFLLFTASLINYFDRATVSFALPLIAADFNLDAAGKGLLSSAFFWSYALMQIPMGLLADRVNL